MKVRIGIALGQWPDKDLKPEAILDLVDSLEALDVDSLWVSDRLVSSALILEPITFLSYVAGRLRKMKFGTSTLVLPTRNPIVLAKELATLDFLSQGRLFPAIGLGGDESKDLQALGVSKKERAARTDEMIVLMRRLVDGRKRYVSRANFSPSKMRRSCRAHGRKTACRSGSAGAAKRR